MSLVEMQNNPNKAVDIETGDMYNWDFSVNEWVKEESVSRETVVSPVEDNAQLPVQSDSVQALETKVTGLEQNVETLSQEVAVLSSAVSDYNLGTTNLSIFEGIIRKSSLGDHYVYWRDSEYRYCLAVGPLTWYGTSFVGNGLVTVYSYERHSSSSSSYTWTSKTDENFYLSVGSRLVYSDLGHYPSIAGKEERYNALTAYCAVGVVLFALFDRLRRSCIR